tara:strand:- start:1212 stop:1934 length:723 start_codon:yes stop_codon:yes gene_type:complete
MKFMKNIEVCFTTTQFNNYNNLNSTVVVVDLLRATTVISVAFECGVDAVIPVSTIENALSFKDKKDHIIAAERNTILVEGFNFGNSPYHYLNADVRENILVLTTTNGTKAIELAKNHKVVTASFVNLNAIVDFLVEDRNDIIILCSGWKGFFNLEDTIFAGALSKKLLETNHFTTQSDSMYASIELYNSAKNDLFKYLSSSAYRRRNQSKEVIKDTRFCLNPHITSEIVPLLDKDRLIKA